MEETNYVRSGSHCKHPAYTKEEIDAKLLTKLDVSDIVVLKCYGCYVEANNFNTHEFRLPNGMSSTGYTILSAVVEHNKYNDMHDGVIRPVYNESVGNSNATGVNPKAWLGENSIHLTVYNPDATAYNYTCTIVLLKVSGKGYELEEV